MPLLFIIKCQKDKYYLGLSNSFVSIFFKHFENQLNIHWLTIYKPMQLLYIEHFFNIEKLNKTVINYMYIYGIENVRGGDYSNVILSRYQYDEITTKFNENV
tara:strand:+ start:815 stop:1120 length:306 start_codon:yes stop_codon:yes gene_type:complete